MLALPAAFVRPRRPAPLRRSLRSPQHPAVSGAALRHDQGRRLSARLRGGHEAAAGRDRRHRRQSRPRPPSTTPSRRWNARAACWSGSTTPSSAWCRPTPIPRWTRCRPWRRPSWRRTTTRSFSIAKLFARVKALYDQRASLKLDAEALQVLTLYYRQFVHAGANLSDKDKTRLQADQQARRQPGSRLPAEAGGRRQGGRAGGERQGRSGGPVSDAEIANAAQAAKARKLTGKYVIPLQNTTQQPLLTSLANRAVREKLFNAQLDAHRKGRHATTPAPSSPSWR